MSTDHRPLTTDHRTPATEYEQRLAVRRERIAVLDRSHLWISNGRLLLALAGAVLLWAAFVPAAISPLWPLAVWLAFGALVVVHAKVLQRVDRARNAER